MTVIETIKIIDKRERDALKRAEQAKQRDERERLEQKQREQNHDTLYQDFEIFVGKERYIANTKFEVYPPNFEYRSGAIKIDWVVRELHLHNDVQIIFNHNDLKLQYYQVTNAIQNQVVERLTAEITNTIKIYPYHSKGNKK